MGLPRLTAGRFTASQQGNGGSPVTAGATDWTALGRQTGDLLVALVCAAKSTPAAISCNNGGWTEEAAASVDGGVAAAGKVYWRVSTGDGNDDASWSSDGTSSDGLIVVLYTVPAGDFDPADPFDVVATGTATGGTTINAPTAAQTVTGGLALRVAMVAHASVPGSSSTQGDSVGYSTHDPGNAVGVWLGFTTRIKAGAVGTCSFSFGGTTNSLLGFTLVLKPNPSDTSPYIADRSAFKASTQAAGITFTKASDSDVGGALDIQDGDKLVIVAAHADTGTDPVFTPPAGFTQAPRNFVDGGIAATGVMYWKDVASAAGEPATYVLTSSLSSGTRGFVGVLFVIRGANPGAPSATNSNTQTATQNPTINAAAVPDAHSLCLYAMAFGHTSVVNYGITVLGTKVVGAGNDPGDAAFLYVSERIQHAAATPGNMQISATTAVSANSEVGLFASFAPAPPPAEGEMSLEGIGELTMEGFGRGLGSIVLEATGSLEIETVESGQGAVELEAIGELTIQGRAVDTDTIDLFAVGELTMEGQQVGGFTTVLVPLRSTMALEGAAELEVGSVEDNFATPEGEPMPPDPTVHVKRMIRVAPSITSFLNDDGRPDIEAWTAAYPEPVVLDWGRLRVKVGGRWVSNFRGVPVQVLNWTEVEPFGDEAAEIAFPQISPFEELPSWLNDDANVTIYQQIPAGDLEVIWEGLVDSIDDDDRGVLLQCMGAAFQANDYRNRARLIQEDAKDIGELIARELTPWARDRNAFRCASVNRVTTGIKAFAYGGWEPILEYVEDLLARAHDDDGDQWSIWKDPGRRLRMGTKNRVTEHYSVHAGEPGVILRLRRERGTTTLFGEGVSEDGCKWYNAKYPNIRYGDLPVFSGTLIHPGETHTDYGLFTQELANRGWSGFIAKPGNTYDFDEESDVRNFQEQSGIQVDGIVGPQTWAAAFGVGASAGDLAEAFVHSLYSENYTESQIRASDGAPIGPNPNFERDRRRIERYENLGGPLSKSEGMRSSRIEVQRDSDLGLFGTIELSVDPPEVSRFEIRAGRNIRAREYRGGSPLLHIARKEVDWETGVVTLLVDEKARDHMTLAAMLERDRETENPARRKEVTRRNRRSSQTQDNKPIWDCENGAGVIPAHAIYAGLWNVIRIPAGRSGTIVRSYFQVENPTQLAVGIFDRPMTAAQMLKGSGADAGNPLAYLDYWNQFGDELLVAWGGGEAPAGWWPHDGPDDDDAIDPTGILDDRGSWYFESTAWPWLWVALWVEPRSNLENNIAYIQGRLQASNEPY